MIRTTLAALALLSTTPAIAGEILPHLFAQTYCDARSVGISRTDAIDMALKAATTDGEPQTITYKGKQERSDVLNASLAVVRRCPQY